MCAKQFIDSPGAIGSAGEEQHAIHERLKLAPDGIVSR
jgi:hypothetical protein